MFRSYKFRLIPNKSQYQELKNILDEQRTLYNAALQERISYYEKTKKSISYFDQCKSLKEIELSGPVNMKRWTLKRLDDSFKAFFKRGKGYPRYRSMNRWKSFGFAEFSGIQLKNNRISFKGLSKSLRFYKHRDLPNDIKSCVISRDTKGWSISFQVDIGNKPELREGSRQVGVDLGLNVFAYLSDGNVIPNPRIARKAEKELRRRQRALSRCKKGSNRRKKVKHRVSKLYEKIKNTRNTFLHQITSKLIRDYDIIGVEDLNIKGMARGWFSKSIHDASWSKFILFLTYKAEGAGVYLDKVNPRKTSILCSGCGNPVPKSLSDRVHYCDVCGLVMDRDMNAALNIDRAVVRPERHNVGGCIMRVSGNIDLGVISN